MTLRIRPLGGLGQIGSNMVQVSNDHTSIIIDCGILFPYEDTFGIDYLIPNFTQIDRPESVLITHGHEDHIGALPHLLEKFPELIVHAPPFAAELIQRKIGEYPRKITAKIKNNIKGSFIFKGFTVDYIQVNHSIPDTFGLLINDLENEVSLFYVSDFKVDPIAKWEPYFDFNKLKKLSRFPKRLLMADSTNITSSQLKTFSEEDLIPALDKILKSDKQRVFLTTFSSNIHRMINVIQLSQRNQRKVVLYGRSCKGYYQTAFDLALIPSDVGRIYDVSEIDLQKDRLLVLLSGCQGDFRGAFRRVSSGNDTYFKPRRGDLFVLSSKPIPGNEKSISLCLNDLAHQEADIVTSSDALIHASGHAGLEDLKILINEFNPTHYIPIHGETFFLQRHQQFLAEHFPNIHSYLLLNQEEFNLTNFTITKNTEDLGPILVSGKRLLLSKTAIRDRRKISENGLCTIQGILDKNRRVAIQNIDFYGLDFFTLEEESEAFKKNIENICQRAIKGSPHDAENIRIQVRKYLVEKLGVKPVVKVFI